MKQTITIISTFILFAVHLSAQSIITMYGVDTATADKAIQRYHGLFNATPGSDHAHKDATISQYNRSRTAFIIPASALQYLINNKNCDNIVFELGYGPIIDPTTQKEEQAIQIFYTGLQSIPGENNKYNQITLDSMINGKAQSFVLDNSAPCPTCYGVGPHSVNGNYNKASVIGILHCPSCNPAVSSTDIGTITPDAYEQVDFGKAFKVSWAIKSTYKVQRVLLNGAAVDSSQSTSYQISHTVGYNTIRVEVVPSGK